MLDKLLATIIEKALDIVKLREAERLIARACRASKVGTWLIRTFSGRKTCGPHV
jgi:hypothetical protein